MSSVITLTTDFGEGSSYVAQLKGVILSLNPQVTIVDLSHCVPPQDIWAGACVLGDCCWRFPPGTVHVAVVDPGVGTDRALIAAQAGGHSFVAPDNGLLTLVLRQRTAAKMVQLTHAKYWLADISQTFHGRDIMAPVAAHLTLGVELSRMGTPTSQMRELAHPSPRVEEKTVRGQVIWIDSFGNAVTNVDQACLPPDWGAAEVRIPGHDEIRGLVATYAAGAAGSLVALIGSNRKLELAIVNGNAARQLGLVVGQPVEVRWP